MPRKTQRRRKDPNVPKNAPVIAIAAAALMLLTGAGIVISGNGGKGDGSLLVGLVVTTIPGLLAAGYAERTSRDVRNGTVTEKARQGARKAIAEAGVVTRDGPAVQAALTASAASTAALTTLLERIGPQVAHNTDVTEAVADALDVHHDTRPEEGENAPQQRN